jgi:hypothetical protein
VSVGGDAAPFPAGCDVSTTGVGAGVVVVVTVGVAGVGVAGGGAGAVVVGAVVVGAGGVGATAVMEAGATFGWPTWRGAVAR